MNSPPSNSMFLIRSDELPSFKFNDLDLFHKVLGVLNVVAGLA